MTQPQEVDFFRPEVLADPYPFYKEAYASCPVIKVRGHGNTYCVFSNALYREVVERVQDFSNNHAFVSQGDRQDDAEILAIMKDVRSVDTMVTADPPLHTRYRQIANRGFTKARIDALRVDMEAIANRLMDRIVKMNGRCDFVQDFAVPLSTEVIARHLGVPDKLDRVKKWSDAITDRFGALMSRERELECARLMVEFYSTLSQVIDERRRQPPVDDLLGVLVQARLEDGRLLNKEELCSILFQLTAGGNETTSLAITRGMMMLIANPDQQQLVRNDRALMPSMVEEIIRFQTPPQSAIRIATHDTTLGGYDIPGGSTLYISMGAANRDPEAFEQPDKFDVRRERSTKYASFGKGPHFCIGAALARAEIAIAFECIFNRLDDIAIAEGFVPTFIPHRTTPTISSLLITFKSKQS